MKTTKAVVCAIAASTALAMTVFAVPGHHFGTDIFHYHVHSTMVNQGVEPGAAGNVAIIQDEQGRADLQKLDVTARGLSPNTPYELDASTVGSTNSFAVTGFTTDAHGNAALHFQKNGNGQNAGQGQGNGKLPLPPELTPLIDVQQLAIVNSNVQPVLVADSTDHLQYLVKRDLSTGDVTSLLMIHANDQRADVKLASSGLATNSVYGLALNGNVVDSGTSDSHGRLALGTVLTNSSAALQISSVALVDAGTNVVTSTTLP